MIFAKKAYRKTTESDPFVETVTKIENEIYYAIESGEFSVEVEIGNKEKAAAVLRHFEGFGYKTYEFQAKPNIYRISWSRGFYA